MTKKKRQHPGVDEILQRPWCYYCERDFDDLKILINHQKAKHFKCERCGRRLNTAGGLSVHMSQVHKENLTAVDNALPNRTGLDIEIFGMEGIPEDIVLQHNQRVLTQYHQAEAERRAATGNPAPGVQAANPAKKPKTEDISDLKKRLAEHKAAKLAAEQNDGDSSRSGTPSAVTQSQAPGIQATSYQAGAPGYQHYSQPYAPPPSTTSFSQPPSFAATTAQPVSYQAPGFPQAASPVYGQPPVQPPYPPAQYGQPPQLQYAHPHPYPQQPFSPPPFPGQAHFPGQPFSPPVPHNGHVPYPAQSPGPLRPFGNGSPTVPQPQQQRTQSPSQHVLPQRSGSGSLPAAPGLPQRPAFGAPQVNAFQFQQMHQGQIPAPHNHVPQPQYGGPPGTQTNGVSAPAPGTSQETPNTSSIDDLISSASKQADVDAAAITATKAATPKPIEPPTPSAPQDAQKQTTAEEKGAKKEKEKPKQTRLVYSDNEVSPEEKMARLPKYAFTPQQTITA